MTTRFPRLQAFLNAQLWLMEPVHHALMVEIVENRVAGVVLTPEEIRQRAAQHVQIADGLVLAGVDVPNGTAAMFEVSNSGRIFAARGGGSARVAGDAEPGSLIAVINVMGVIAHHASQVDNISGPGGTSTARVGQAFDAAMDDPAVKAIVFHVDSPGGGVPGVQELADKIYAARGRKPIIAQVNSTAASAAYWIISQADEIVVTPSGQVGSIGVYGSHKDVSAAAEKQGLKVTFFAYPPQKVDGHPFAPPSAEFTDKQMADVKAVYGDFSGAVARGRGVKSADVEAGFGKGGVELAKNAIKLGMVDRVGTMEDTLRRVAKMKVAPANARADADTQFAEAADDEAMRALSAQAQVITINSTEAGPVLVGAWPPVTRIGAELIQTPPPGISVAGDHVTFALNNDSASYLRAATKAGEWLCVLQPGSAAMAADETALSAAQAAETQAAAEREAFRRRRHAHRSRFG